MEYVAFVFGIFGFFAYLETSSLKKKVKALEEQMTKIGGTSYQEDRTALVKAAKTYIGKTVTLDMKEDYMDVDVVNYGNTKHGTITVTDADDDWLRVRIETPKGEKDKLLRMGSVERIAVLKEE